LTTFFASRSLRILPLYYATLLVVLVVLPLLHLWPAATPTMAAALTFMVSNWFQPFNPGGGSLPHFWSLAVEEQFYLLWPFLIWHLSPKGIVKLCLGVVFTALLARGVMLYLGLTHEAVYEWSICRMDALACGGAAAALLRWPGVRERLFARPGRWLAMGVGVLLFGAAACKGYTQYTPTTQTLGYLCLSVGFALAVLAAACADLRTISPIWAAPLRQAWLRRVGLYSYAMYVLHVPLHVAIALPLLKAWGLHPTTDLGVTLAYLAVGTLAVFAAGALSYHAFELHFLRLKERVRRTLAGPGPLPV
jgi:peptidoglycan/LPS O-acetylase OafA/YrhL